MKKIIFTSFMIVLFSTMAFSQQLTQTVRGTIFDLDSQLPLIGTVVHFVMGYEKRIGKNIRVTLQTYYQNLYNLPVENNDTSFYATINEGTDFRYVELAQFFFTLQNDCWRVLPINRDRLCGN